MQSDLLPNGRKVIWIGNQELQIALAHGGGHIAALRCPALSPHLNPYWIPPWPSLEPEDATAALVESEYGGAPDGRLLASILGHNLCLDLYGAPSAEEKAAGAVLHGNIGALPWTWKRPEGHLLEGECRDVLAQLQFTRRLEVKGHCVVVEESVQNLCAWDRPMGWQQHVSLGAPFCEEGFWAQASCDRGSTHPQTFGAGASLIPGTETEWPFAPRRAGGRHDYREPLEAGGTANDFSGYRMRPSDELAGFIAGNTRSRFALFYLWPRRFFPWMGIWDEKHARDFKPWSGNASVRAYEFGASPFPGTRREILAQPVLFGVPTYLMLPARARFWVRYLFGVFPDVAEKADFVFSTDAVALVKEGREITRVPLPEKCASSGRAEMNRAVAEEVAPGAQESKS